MNKAAKMYLCYWNDTLVAMGSTLFLPSGTLKGAYRQHRLVVLPDYQGLGIGTKLNQFLAEYYLSQGNKYFIRTSHLRLGEYLRKRTDWVATMQNQKLRSQTDIDNHIASNNSTNRTLHGDRRICYSYEYVGDNYGLPKQYIVCMGDCKKQEATNYLEKIVKLNHYIVVITGNAKKELNVWEEVAKEKGWRTEILYVNRKGEMVINASRLKNQFDAIIIGKDNQRQIAKYRQSKDIPSLITFNYKYDTPKYYERIAP